MFLFVRFQIGLEKLVESAVPVGLRHPGGDGVGVALIRCEVEFAALNSETVAKQSRIDFDDSRPTGANVPAVEGPEVGVPAFSFEFSADVE